MVTTRDAEMVSTLKRGPFTGIHTLQDEQGLCTPCLFKHTSRLSASCNNNAQIVTHYPCMHMHTHSSLPDIGHNNLIERHQL